MFTVFNFFGSMALFLFGVKFMGEGFESVLGSRLKAGFRLEEKKPLSYVILGLLVTVLVQFSAITTIMTVGMVNSGIITLMQAMGLIIGANIATAIKVPVFLLNPYIIMPFFAMAGTLLYVFSRGKKHRDLSRILIGLAVASISLENIHYLFSGFKGNEFMSVLGVWGDSLGVIFMLGLIFSIILQSSSATMVIIMALASAGMISPRQAFFAIAGANIGTTSTTIVSAIGGGTDGKRAAFLHFFFNLTGAVLLLPFSKQIVRIADFLDGNNLGMNAAIMHILFNAITGIIFLLFMKQAVALSKILIRDRKSDVCVIKSDILDRRIINTPALAEQQMINHTLKLAETARENVRLSMESFIESDSSLFFEIDKNEDTINYMEVEIVDFLVKLSAAETGEDTHSRIAATHQMIADFERIGDLAVSIRNLASEKIDRNVTISPDAMTELKAMNSYMMEAINIVIDSYRNGDKNMASQMVDISRKTKEMQEKYRENHIKRLNRGKCTPFSGILFLDVISTAETIVNLAAGIAQSVIKDLAL